MVLGTGRGDFLVSFKWWMISGIKFVQEPLKLTRTILLVVLSIIGQRRAALSLRLLLLDAALGGVQIQSTVLHALVNLASRFQERFLHILPSHCARLGEHQPILVGKLFRLLVRDLARRLQVALVADEENDCRRVREVLRVGEPRAEVVVSGTSCDVVHHQATSGASVVAARDSSESLLASSLKSH